MWNISPLKVSIIVSHDDTVVMDIVFQPPQVKSYSVDMSMVYDNCNVNHFYIKGKYYCEPWWYSCHRYSIPASTGEELLCGHVYGVW